MSLKPCPFCGEEAAPASRGNPIIAFIECVKCGAETGGHFDQDNAIDAWNNRPMEDFRLRVGEEFKASAEALNKLIREEKSRVMFLEAALREAVDCGSFRIEVIPDDSTIYKAWRHKGETLIVGTAATEEFLAGDPKTEPNLAKWLSERS